MRIAPTPVPDETLHRVLADQYGLELRSLGFREKGWGGYSYLAEEENGHRFFAKLQPVAGPEWASAPSAPGFYLPLLQQLDQQQVIRVPRLVLPRDGGYSTVVDGHELILYDFIDGQVLGFGPLPEPVLAELAEMVGKLHAATAQLHFEHPFRERYGLGVKPDLVRVLARLGRAEPAAAFGEALLRANRERIVAPVLDHLNRFRTYQSHVRTLNKPQVICHTDLHGGNLMHDLDGELVLLDWENAMLAPPEHDLFFVAGTPEYRDIWLPRYQATAGPVEVDPGLFGFYWYRRALEDVAGFLTRILAGDGDEYRDRSDLEYLLENIAWLDRIDADVAEFRASL